jgi:hypothetical protein
MAAALPEATRAGAARASKVSRQSVGELAAAAFSGLWEILPGPLKVAGAADVAAAVVSEVAATAKPLSY